MTSRVEKRQWLRGIIPYRQTWVGAPMSGDTATELLSLARQRYGRKNARLAVLVRTGAIEKTVDNVRDALESIRRLKADD